MVFGLYLRKTMFDHKWVRNPSRGVITIFPAICSPAVCISQLDLILVALRNTAINYSEINHFHIYFLRIAGEDSGIADKVLQDVIQFIGKWFKCVHSLTLLFRDPDIHKVSLSYFFCFSR
jgi:hypothetical protein